jgi:hypothetical protein
LTVTLVSACGERVNEYAELQRESLRHLYYRNGPLPPSPDRAELGRVTTAVAAAAPWERAALDELFPGDVELWAYAIRDSDGDGIHDFRISDYYGRFLEGDTDVDGDGIDNVLDPNPFDARSSDRQQLSAAASWAAHGRSPADVDLQSRLLANHRVLLVERSAEFPPGLARVVEDVLTRVYRSIFANNGTLSTLRVIATEETALLPTVAEDDSTDFAQVLPATQTMEIYRPGIDAPAAIQLGFLVHEIGHNVQFEMDYDARRQDEIMRRNAFVAEHFHRLVADYGWTTVDYEPDPEAEFTLFRPQYVTPDTYGYLYHEETPEEWAAWLAAIYDEVGEEAYLSDSRLLDYHIPGDYSLSGPWEWYSDHLIAYVYIAMLDTIKDSCTEAGWDALRQSFQEDIVRASWPYFRFENARGAPIQDYLAKTFPLDPADVDYLAGKYMADLIGEYCR